MRNLFKLALAIAARLAVVAFSAAPAFGQGAILQGGPITAGHAPMYLGGGQQPIVLDSGPAGGGDPGLGLSEQLQVNRGAAGTGTGPLGTHLCSYDAPITSATGYHYLCFDANAQGGGLVTYGAGGGAAPLGLNFNVNGVVVPVGGVASRVTVGISPITGGTNTRVLFDNAGVFGEYTNAQLTALINPATASLSGALPAWPNNPTTFFRGDGTYTTLSCATLTNAGAFCNGTDAAGLTGTVASARLAGAYNGITSAGVTINTSPITGGTNGSCLYVNAGVIGQQGCSSGGSVASTKVAPYAVTGADCSTVIPLGGATYFTQSLGAAGGFPANCRLVFINTDSARAKSIAINGYSAFKLWPLQTVVATNLTSAWSYDKPGRWKTPGGVLDLYADYTNGNDSNDCLNAGAGNACKTANGAMYKVCDQFDFTGTNGGQTQVVINLASSTTDLDGVHYSCPLISAQGGAAFTLAGGSSSSICPASAAAVGAFIAGVTLQIQNLTLCSGASAALSVGLGARVYIMGGVIFGTSAAAHISVSDPGSHVIINASYQISGGAAEHYLVQNSAAIQSVGTYTATWSANGNFTYFALSGTMGNISLPNMTYNCNGFTCTGKRYEADNLALIYTGGGGATYFPGDVAGSVSTGGVYNYLLRRDLFPHGLRHDNDNRPVGVDVAA